MYVSVGANKRELFLIAFLTTFAISPVYWLFVRREKAKATVPTTVSNNPICERVMEISI
jgi:hypothetical protein